MAMSSPYQRQSSVRPAVRAPAPIKPDAKPGAKLGAKPGAGSSLRRFFAIAGSRKPLVQGLRVVVPGGAFDDEQPAVDISPTDGITRRRVSWDGAAAETVECPVDEEIVFRFNAPAHLLVVYEQGERETGETSVDGLPSSSLRKLSGRMTFVPAGHDYREVHRLGTPGRLTFFYFEPVRPMAGLSLAEEPALAPRLFFEDPFLWHSATKLSARLRTAPADDRSYLKALAVVLMHDLIRGGGSTSQPSPAPARGGLAGWQQRLVTGYIREHFSEPIRLATLARLARLSPHHFCRAFKQSFGKPPHRYQNDFRIERAKQLLARPGSSVTDIALQVGFGSSSSFATAFRKVTGQTPTGYARSLLA